MPQVSNSQMRDIAQNVQTVISKAPGQHYFLGIGINNYQHFPKLNNAVRDVKAVANILTQRYQFNKEHTVLLLDKEATRAQIIRQLDNFLELLGPNDCLLIYYSGHGHLNKKTERGYWIPVDAAQNQTADYINNSIIKNYIEDISSLHTLLISDSCFSGTLFVRGETRSSLAIEELEQRQSRWAFCSGRHDELVYDGKPGQNSPFSASIIKVLQRNRSAKLNLMKLINEVVELTRAQYQQLPEGNPLFHAGHEGGQFVFKLQNGEAEAWANCQKAGTVGAYQLFLHQYPKGKNAALAQKKMEELEKIELAKLQQTILQTSTYPNDGPEMTMQLVSGSAISLHLNSLEQKTLKLQQALLTWRKRTRLMAGLILIPIIVFSTSKLLPKQPIPKHHKAQITDSLQREKQAFAEKLLCDSIPYFYQSIEKPVADSMVAIDLEPLDFLIIDDTLKVTISEPEIGKEVTLLKKGKVLFSAKMDTLNTTQVDLIPFRKNPGTYYLQLSEKGVPPISQAIVIHPAKGSFVAGEQSYSTINYHNLTWTADNLNIDVQGSWCYDDSLNNCKDFGRLYTQQAATKVCKKLGNGWRLPTQKEFRALARFYGGIEEESDDGGMNAYNNLTAHDGFNAKLGGWSTTDHLPRQIHEKGGYWTSSDKGQKESKIISFSNGKVGLSNISKDAGLSCRCVLAR